MLTRVRGIGVAGLAMACLLVTLAGCPITPPAKSVLEVEPATIELTQAEPEATITVRNIGEDILNDAIDFTAESDNENVVLSAGGGSLPGDFEVDITVEATAFEAADYTATLTFTNTSNAEDVVEVAVTVRAAVEE